MSTIYDYDIDSLTKELQKILKIQDWDIAVRFRTANNMRCSGFDANTQGLCSRDRHRNGALIEINTDHEDNKVATDPEFFDEGWFSTYIHELLHVVVDSLSEQSETILEFISDDKTKKNLEKEYNKKQERLINHLTNIIVNTMNVEELLSKHKKEKQDGSSSEKTE